MVCQWCPGMVFFRWLHGVCLTPFALYLCLDFLPGSILPGHWLKCLYSSTTGRDTYSQHTEGHPTSPKDQDQERGGTDLNQDKSVRTRLEKMSSWWPGVGTAVLRLKFQASRFPDPLTLQKRANFSLRASSPSLLEDPSLNDHFLLRSICPLTKICSFILPDLGGLWN